MTKGGVGKTLLAEQIAVRLALLGKRVLALDLSDFGYLFQRLNCEPTQRPDSHVSVGRELFPVRPTRHASLDCARIDPQWIEAKPSAFLERLAWREHKRLALKYQALIIDTATDPGSSLSNALRFASDVLIPLVPEPQCALRVPGFLQRCKRDANSARVSIVFNNVGNYSLHKRVMKGITQDANLAPHLITPTLGQRVAFQRHDISNRCQKTLKAHLEMEAVLLAARIIPSAHGIG